MNNVHVHLFITMGTLTCLGDGPVGCMSTEAILLTKSCWDRGTNIEARYSMHGLTVTRKHVCITSRIWIRLGR